MPDETGLKWWIRFVIVPIIGGGGIIALIVAYGSRPPRPPVDGSPTKLLSATEGGTVAVEEPPPETKTPAASSVMPESRSAKPPAGMDSRGKSAVNNVAPARLEPPVQFGAFKKDGTKLPGDDLHLSQGIPFILKWKIKSEKVHGSLVLETGFEYPRDKSVGYEGAETYECGERDNTYVVALVDRIKGNDSALGLIRINCSAN